MHPLEPLKVYRLEDVEKLINNPDFDAKPSNMDSMNQILKFFFEISRFDLSDLKQVEQLFFALKRLCLNLFSLAANQSVSGD
ncbi:unnamed protein product [Trichobilharzia regenti]|nr:unnamed protein product [Trichobilharzia regenti]